MNETQKPFACSVKDCDMTFTNEDHLNWHQKKHEMMLNLGIANKNSEGADQTPTPTRFIRNCEEVGLFQDLQNLNPFDEFFKKAVEGARSGTTLEVPLSQNNDDTLHTPHILPHIEESKKNTSCTTRKDNNSQSNDFLNIIPLTENDAVQKTNVSIDSQTPIIIIQGSPERNTEPHAREPVGVPSVKSKIKEILQTKDQQKVSIPVTKYATPVPLETVTNKKQSSSNTGLLKKDRGHIDPESYEKWKDVSPISLEKIREMNRAAQNRCRKRKREVQKIMEQELKELRIENKRLRTENKKLKFQLAHFSKANEGNLNNEGQMDMGKQNVNVQKKEKTSPSKSSQEPMNKVPIQPGKFQGPVTSPIIYKLVPAIAIPVTPCQHCQTDSPPQGSFRKVAPKIIISNS